MIPKPTIIIISGFDPQALTSLTRTERTCVQSNRGFDPQALTSLTAAHPQQEENLHGFDPQALTSLTVFNMEIIAQ